MMRILPRSQGNVVGVLLTGKITKDDYNKVLIPALDQAKQAPGKIRLLMEFAENFSGYSIKAMYKDARYGFKNIKYFEKCAMINAPSWVRMLMKIFDKLTPWACRNFETEQRDKAWEFIEK